MIIIIKIPKETVEKSKEIYQLKYPMLHDPMAIYSGNNVICVVNFFIIIGDLIVLMIIYLEKMILHGMYSELREID